MTNTRGLYDYKFALLNRGRCWTSCVLIPPPHNFFRVEKLKLLQWSWLWRLKSSNTLTWSMRHFSGICIPAMTLFITLTMWKIFSTRHKVLILSTKRLFEWHMGQTCKRSIIMHVEKHLQNLVRNFKLVS